MSRKTISSNTLNQSVTAATRTTSVGGELPPRIIELIHRGNYAAAYGALKALPRWRLHLNCLGVCAMRIGHADEAVQLFRNLSLNPGTTVVRSDADDSVLINYAFALLYASRPSGALDVLGELKNPEAAAAIQMRKAIRNWERGLSFMRRLDWKLNRIEPPNCHVPLDFELGIFPFAIRSGEVTPPVDPRRGPSKHPTSELAA